MPNSCPAITQICLYQGDDFAAVAEIFDADGAPADLSGYVALAQLRLAVADEASTVEAEFATTISGSTVLLALSHDETQRLSGRYCWDLELTSGDGTVTTVLAGHVSVTAEVSRAAMPLLTAREAHRVRR